MLTRERKEKQITQFTDDFKKSEGTFIVHFKGLNADQVSELRSSLRSQQAQMRVIRNTLAKRVFKELKIEKEVTDSFNGSNAFIFVSNDVSGTAKVLSQFAEDTSLELKKGIISEQILLEKDIQKLATLPSLDELRAQFLSLLSTPAQSFVRICNEVPSSAVRVINAKSKKINIKHWGF